ncbi:hypothetical protein HanIR_Chr14g0677391 [Helianthus annuus]|nr:hypothetical protein HanIR_Chr14g0677391 [Helianthus annuus]
MLSNPSHIFNRNECRPDETQTPVCYQEQKLNFKNESYRQLHDMKPSAPNTAVALPEITLQLAAPINNFWTASH